MRRLLLIVLLSLPVAALAASKPKPAEADAQTPPVTRTLDLKTFSRDQLRLRMKDACIYRQSAKDKDDAKVVPVCTCYSNRLITQLSDAELDAYRKTADFNASGHQKADAALASCKK